MVKLLSKDPSSVSPVVRLLKTNDPPTETELSATTKAIANAQHELDNILLGPDRARVGRLAKFIRVHRAVLSPIRRVPFELLVSIFSYVFWDDTIDITHPPFLLAHVCRLWRGIIINRKMLDLATVPPPLRLTSSGRFFQRKKHVIRSCPNSPLSFSVLDHIKGESHPALDALITRPTSWKCVSLDLNISSLHFLNENLVFARIQHLTKLQLKVTSPLPFSSFAFEDAPALTDVEIESNQKLLISLPWKQIKSYRERSSFDIGVSFALRYGVQLLHFSYSTSNPSPFITRPPPSTLPCLKVLEIKIYHEDHFIALQLKTPRLEELTLRDHGHRSFDRLREHLRFCCGYFLKRLAFHVENLKTDMLAQILLLLPNLEELECTDIPPKALERLGRDDPPLLGPLLRRLIIHQTSDAVAIDNLITCRSQFGPTEHTLLSGSKKPGLDRVILVFANAEECDVAAVALGIQDPCPRDDLVNMRGAITQLDLACKSGLIGMSSDQASGVNKALSKLETFAIEDPSEIDLRAVNVVKRFWWLAPLETRYKFSDRARILWDIWRVILSTRIRQADRIRWIHDESNSLLHLKAFQEDRAVFERDLLSAPWQDDRDNLQGFTDFVALRRLKCRTTQIATSVQIFHVEGYDSIESLCAKLWLHSPFTNQASSIDP